MKKKKMQRDESIDKDTSRKYGCFWIVGEEFFFRKLSIIGRPLSKEHLL